MTIDAHLHVWDRSRSGYAWLDGAGERLQRGFSLADAAADLDALGIDRVVLVQADESRDETRVMLDAAADPRVAAIVAWVPLEDPDLTRAELDWFDEHPVIRGVRVLNHDRPDPRWVLQDSCRVSVDVVRDAGLPYELVAVTPAQLEVAPQFADDHPGLTVVLDHLGKPPVGGDADDLADWADRIRRFAAREGTVAKLSGLYGAGVSVPSASELRPVVDIALEAFGPDRLMLGSDWPVCAAVVDDGFRSTWSALDDLVSELSVPEGDEIRDGTATRIYRLGHDV